MEKYTIINNLLKYFRGLEDKKIIKSTMMLKLIYN